MDNRKAKPPHATPKGWDVAETAHGDMSESGPTIGQLTITKVVRESIPVKSGGTATIGDMINDQLNRIAKEGGEVSEITLALDPAQWGTIVDAAHGISR